MLSRHEHDKLFHDLKRAAKVLKMVHDETDHEKRQALISLLSDVLDGMAENMTDLTEKQNETINLPNLQ